MNQNQRTCRVIGTWALFLAAVTVFGLGCAAMQPEKPKTLSLTERGTVLFLDKYEFKRPPQNWALMKNLEGGDFELGFLLMEKGEFPSQTTFMYDEEPYGGSQNLEKRAKYYCTRFLFNSGIDVRVNIVGLAIDELMLRETFQHWARLGHGQYLDAQNAEELLSGLVQAIDQPYEVRDASGAVVANGTINGPAIELLEGTYTVHTATREQPLSVVVKADETTVLTLTGE